MGPGGRSRRHRQDRRRRRRPPSVRPRPPPAGCRADGDPDRPCRGAAPDRRLPRPVGHGRDPRRAVQLAAQHEAARGEGLHVRGGRGLRPPPCRRAVRGARRGEHGGDGPGRRRLPRRAGPDPRRARRRRRSSQAARDFLVGVFPLRFETPGPIVGALSGLVVHDLPEDELARYRPAIEAVTVEDVLEAARSRIEPIAPAILLVGDADAFGAETRGGGLRPGDPRAGQRARSRKGGTPAPRRRSARSTPARRARRRAPRNQRPRAPGIRSSRTPRARTTTTAEPSSEPEAGSVTAQATGTGGRFPALASPGYRCVALAALGANKVAYSRRRHPHPGPCLAGVAGRLLSLYILTSLGVIPFGNLLAGAIAERFGPPLALAGGGTATLVILVIVAINFPGAEGPARRTDQKQGLTASGSGGIIVRPRCPRAPEDRPGGILVLDVRWAARSRCDSRPSDRHRRGLIPLSENSQGRAMHFSDLPRIRPPRSTGTNAVPHKRHERGQSVVEFALVLPILVFLMLAVVDFSRIFTTMLSIESAAREAADFGTFGSQKWNDASPCRRGTEADDAPPRLRCLEQSARLRRSRTTPAPIQTSRTSCPWTRARPGCPTAPVLGATTRCANRPAG